MKTFIDFVYTLLIAAGVILFVSLGIWAFYSGPQAPSYPQGPYIYSKDPTAAQEKQMEQQQKKFDNDMKIYNDKEKPYNRNVAIISLAAGVVFFAGGALLLRKNDTVGEGLGLGGIFTAVYASIRAAVASSKPMVFVSVCAVLAMLILLALLRRRIFPKPKAA